jgi:hypothetical protein
MTAPNWTRSRPPLCGTWSARPSSSTPRADEWARLQRVEALERRSVERLFRSGTNDLIITGLPGTPLMDFASRERVGAGWAAPHLYVHACGGCGCRGSTVYQAQLPLLEIWGLIAVPAYLHRLCVRRRRRRCM